MALDSAAALPVTARVSPVTKPLRVPSVSAPAAVLPSYTLLAMLGALMVNALGVIVCDAEAWGVSV